MNFNSIADFYNQNKELIQLLVAAVIYFFGHKKVAQTYVKSKVKTAIFAAEKYSEDLLLQSGAQKMDFVVQKEYAKLPGAVRMFVNLDDLRSIAQKVFNNAALSVKDQLPKAPVVPNAPVTTDNVSF
ncbi:MAG: hypothetical protein JWM44_3516 [Bacilli bacterium]|nr:hypothetical protein [Bacilli bacterium]